MQPQPIWCWNEVMWGEFNQCHEYQYSGALHNIGYRSEIHLKLKSCKISFAHNACFSQLIALKFCPKQGSITAMLYTKLQTDWTIKTDVVDERDFARFGFKISFGQISYIAQYPWFLASAAHQQQWYWCAGYKILIFYEEDLNYLYHLSYSQS